MKKLGKFITLILAMMLVFTVFTGCGETGKIKKHYKDVVAEIKTNLYDPDSLKIMGAEGIYGDGDEHIIYKIDYNAKNRLGGYVGTETYYYYYDFEDGRIYSYTGSDYKDFGETAFHITKSLYDAQENGNGENLSQKYYYKKIK